MIRMSSQIIIDKLICWLIKFILCLVLFIPLYISETLVFPYITGKNFVFRILLELAAALWVVLIIIDEKYRIRNSAILSAVLVFTFIVGLADILGISPYKSFWSNLERMEGYITIIHLTIYFVIVKSMLKTRRDWALYVNIFLVVSLCVSLSALIMGPPLAEYQKYTSSYIGRIYGTLGNPPFLASYLLLSVYVAFIAISFTKKHYLKLIYVLLCVINSSVIYLTATKGAIIAGLIGLIMIASIQIIKSISINRRMVSYSVIILFMVTSSAFLIFTKTDVMKHDITLSRFTNMFSDPSTDSRLRVWNIAWEGIKERPILGWGQENFIGTYSTIPIYDDFTEEWFDRGHNIVIDWLVSAGILGLFSYFAIFGIAFYILMKAYQQKAVSINQAFITITALIVYFIHNLVTFDTINTYIIFYGLLAYVDNIAQTKDTGPANSEGSTIVRGSKFVSISLTLLAPLFFAFVCYHLNYKPIKQLQLHNHINRSLAHYKSFSALLDDYEKALSYRTIGNYFLNDHMIGISNFLLNKYPLNNKEVKKFVQRTLEELDEAFEVNRYDLEFLTNTIEFYMKLANMHPGFIDITEILIKESIFLNPEYMKLHLILSDLYALKGDYESAFALARKVVDKDPQSDAKQWKLIKMAIRTSREKTADDALENMKKIRIAKYGKTVSGENPLFNNWELHELATSYRDAGNYLKALLYYKEYLSVLKSVSIRSAKIRLDIANIYHALGDSESAIKEVKKSKEVLRSLEYDGLNDNTRNRIAVLYSKIAGIYLANGDEYNAVKEARKSAELDPESFSGDIKDINDKFLDEYK